MRRSIQNAHFPLPVSSESPAGNSLSYLCTVPGLELLADPCQSLGNKTGVRAHHPQEAGSARGMSERCWGLWGAGDSTPHLQAFDFIFLRQHVQAKQIMSAAACLCRPSLSDLAFIICTCSNFSSGWQGLECPPSIWLCACKGLGSRQPRALSPLQVRPVTWPRTGIPTQQALN